MNFFIVYINSHQVSRLHWLHVVFTLFLIELTLLLGGGILVLLILRHEVVHVGFGLGEFHFVHTFTSIPVEERLASEHTSEILSNALEHLLDGGGVSEETTSHLQTLGRDIADGGLDVVRDPLHEVGRVLVLHVEHLFINLLGGHAPTEHSTSSQVSSVARVSGAHHVLGVEHLLSQLRNGECAVLLGASGSEGGESGHEEVQTRKGDHVDGNLSQIAVELARESNAAGGCRNGSRDQVVEISISGGSKLQGAEANVVEGLVVHHHNLVRILDKLVERQHSVVGFDD